MLRATCSNSTVLVIGTLLFAVSGSAEIGQPIETHGSWTVHRSLDPMTDAPSCVALYEERAEIQLNEHDLFISVRGRGGVDGVTLRFDNDPPDKMRLARDIEKKISAVDIEGSDFRRALASKRLRVQIITVLSTLVNEDLDLTGIADARAVLTGENCKP